MERGWVGLGWMGLSSEGMDLVWLYLVMGDRRERGAEEVGWGARFGVIYIIP